MAHEVYLLLLFHIFNSPFLPTCEVFCHKYSIKSSLMILKTSSLWGPMTLTFYFWSPNCNHCFFVWLFWLCSCNTWFYHLDSQPIDTHAHTPPPAEHQALNYLITWQLILTSRPSLEMLLVSGITFQSDSFKCHNWWCLCIHVGCLLAALWSV